MITAAGAKCGDDLPSVVVDVADGPYVCRHRDLRTGALPVGAISAGGRISSLRGWFA